jgi:alpha-D-ribose 1-methylphosphonate 5-triphosphate synthase subunit PhnG
MSNFKNDRKSLLALLAKSNSNSINECWKNLNISPEFMFLKKPEIGMVMVRAKAGGDGEDFNMGEMTVTRCIVQLDSKQVGYGYTAGRDKEKSKLIALVDACFQVETLRKRIKDEVLEPLCSLLNQKQSTQKTKTDTSKVNFFTMVRGE